MLELRVLQQIEYNRAASQFDGASCPNAKILFEGPYE
jgi:hypothetical protein